MLWSAAIINFIILSVRGSTSEYDVHRRQILTFKDGHCTEKVEATHDIVLKNIVHLPVEREIRNRFNFIPIHR